jgi:IclR family transcriptional regulator, acetate operon repressor
MSDTSVTAVERVIDILEAFQAHRRPMSLTELSEATHIPKSTCHAIVQTMLARGYLYTLTRPRALYPTRRIFEVTRDIADKDPFIERVIPLLERLRDTTHETVILAKRQGDAVIYLQVVEGDQAIRYSARPGDFRPLHPSSTGKALLGALKEPELRAWFCGRQLTAITETTQTDQEALLQEIKESRRAGYFVSRGENVSDVWAVATNLTVNQESLAIAVAGPRNRMEGYITECASVLVATCSALARQSRGMSLSSG